MRTMLLRKPAVQLPELTWGADTVCRPLSVPLGRGSVLIGGSAGAGKSTVVNAIVAAGSVRSDVTLVGIDPKLVELYPWRARFAEIACDADEIDATLERLYVLMRLRYQWMKPRGLRMWDPAFGIGGWVVPVIDEIADVYRPDPLSTGGNAKTAKDRVVRRRALLEALASMGRAAGITLVTATQTPEADTLGTDYRNNHTQRVCLFVPNLHVATMVLGDVPEGVEPWTIPVGEPGTADVLTGGRVRRGRARYFTDDDVARLAAATAHVRQLAGTLDDLIGAVR